MIEARHLLGHGSVPAWRVRWLDANRHDTGRAEWLELAAEFGGFAPSSGSRCAAAAGTTKERSSARTVAGPG